MFAAAQLVRADETFRFRHGDGVTGIPNWVYDHEGKETTIRFTKDSDPVALFILDSLLDLEGVSGSSGPKSDTRGVVTDQAIILVGGFSSEIKTTPSVENGAGAEDFREFRLTGIRIGVPFAQWIQRDKDDPISSPYAVLYHLSVESIFPKGLSFEGVAINLRELGVKQRGEQGAAPQIRPR